ncbi:MAG TPA: LLM class flavin-dependent oxidoreductase, partial [Vicinamibacteria bacterium]|nr:LLM class flavin-dependent oxidoreductase [Vicinamibacteria bacterium]
EEGLAVLAQAFAGGAVEFTGRHFQISGLRVAPPPVQPGGPPIFLGAGCEVAVRRAARLGCGLLAADAAAAFLYLAAWREAGRDPSEARIALRVDGAGEARRLARDLSAVGRLDLLFAAAADLETLARAATLRSNA